MCSTFLGSVCQLVGAVCQLVVALILDLLERTTCFVLLTVGGENRGFVLNFDMVCEFIGACFGLQREAGRARAVAERGEGSDRCASCPGLRCCSCCLIAVTWYDKRLQLLLYGNIGMVGL